MTEKTQVKNKKRYIPSAFLTIIGLMVLFIIISWIGQAVSDSINGIGILDVFTSIWHGFKDKAEIILFIFAVGGTLGVLTKIRAIDAGIDALVKKLGNKTLILIPVLMFIFGLGGTTYGMWEETIAFIPVLIPVFKKAGYGPFTAMLVILIGSGTGCLASTVNPFATGQAVDAIKKETLVDVSSVMQGTRWLSFVIFEIVGIALVMWQATRYKNGKSIVKGLDEKLIEERFKEKDGIEFTVKRKISLGLFITAFLIMIIMYLPWKNWINVGDANSSWSSSMWWLASTTSTGFETIGDIYFISVAAVFLMITIIIFAVNFNDFKSKEREENQEEGFIRTYMSGVKDMVSVCLLIAVAGGLGGILTETNIGPEIAKSMGSAKLGMIAFGVVMFFISLFLSMLVPSTSGFAGSFMGIFGAIAAQSGLGPEGMGIAILAFIFANGLANFFTPTSAALMGYTSYAGIPYPVWIKQTWKIQVVYLGLALTLIIIFSAMASSGTTF